MKFLPPAAKTLTSKNVAILIVVSAVVHVLVGLGLLYTDRDYLLTVLMMLVNVVLFAYFLPVLF